MSISLRLKAIMQAHGLSIKAFSELTGIPYRSVQNYILEERDPSTEALVKISHHLNINIHWLLTGHGNMLFVESQSEYNAETLQVMKQFSILSERDRNVIKLLISELSK